MFAMHINSDTIGKLMDSDISSHLKTALIITRSSTKSWYFVRGYVLRGGPYVGDTILPAYVVEQLFEHDPNKIKTDWDQIVRK